MSDKPERNNIAEPLEPPFEVINTRTIELKEFQEWFKDVVERGATQLDVFHDLNHHGNIIELVLYGTYLRPETDKEYKERIDYERERKEEKENHDYEHYLKLKEKFKDK